MLCCNACFLDPKSTQLPLSCRGWTLVWGALSLLMTLIPSFRDFRFLNVVALAGTGFTAIYICVSAGVHGFQHNAVNLAPYNFQSFFTGANVFLWAYGGHGVSFEVSCPLCNCTMHTLLTRVSQQETVPCVSHLCMP